MSKIHIDNRNDNNDDLSRRLDENERDIIWLKIIVRMVLWLIAALIGLGLTITHLIMAM